VLQFGIFAVITAGMMALFFALSDGWKPGRARIRRRLAGEYAEIPAGTPTPLYKDVATLGEDEHEQPAANVVAVPAAGPLRKARIENFLREAGVTRPARQLLWIIVASAVLLANVGFFLGGWLVGLTALFAAVAAPLAFLNVKRKARRERYAKQLVTAFELMARVLKAGQPVQEAFRAAVGASDEPLSSEFGLCLHQIEHGIRPELAFRELSDRSGVPELRFFVVAMTIQRQTGGSLTEVLERMAAVVRTRLRLRQKIRALTAEGRLQSLTLVVLPFLTFGVMYFLNRNYAEALLVQWRMLLATAALMGIGMLWIRNIMNFEG
jgi:tight adherence protein B